MEGFTYVDLFATKGIEYIFVISILVVFYFFWKLLNTPSKTVIETAEGIIPAISNWFNLPDGIHYHQGHSWAVSEGGNLVKVGINDFAQKLLGKIENIKVPKVGSKVTQGEKAWNLKIDSKSIEMLSPVNGKVLAINEELINSPEKLNKDPYGESWLIKVQVPKVKANFKNLLSGKLAQKWIEEVQENLLSRMNYNLGTVYLDGGVPVDGIAKNMDTENWDKLAKDFFLISED